MHRAHHLAHDRETRLRDEVEVRGDRAHQGVFDRQQAEVGATLDHGRRDVTEVAIRLRLGVRLEQEEGFFGVGARLSLECYPLVFHRLRLMARTSFRKIRGGSYLRLMNRTNTATTTTR